MLSAYASSEKKTTYWDELYTKECPDNYVIVVGMNTFDVTSLGQCEFRNSVNHYVIIIECLFLCRHIRVYMCVHAGNQVLHHEMIK